MDTGKERKGNDSRLTVSSFVSTPPRQRRDQWKKAISQRQTGYSDGNSAGYRDDKKERSIYMLVRLGVCALCFCTALALKLSDTDDSAMVLNSLNAALNDEYSPDSDLGRLRFVQLPSIIDVFAPSDEPIMPVNVLGLRTMEDNALLCISTTSGADVLAALDCIVKAVGYDEQYGDYVRMTCDNDIEICYFGITEIAVEEGQPVTQKSKLAITAGNELLVRVYDTGRPIEPAEYFEIKIS